MSKDKYASARHGAVTRVAHTQPGAQKCLMKTGGVFISLCRFEFRLGA